MVVEAGRMRVRVVVVEGVGTRRRREERRGVATAMLRSRRQDQGEIEEGQSEGV